MILKGTEVGLTDPGSSFLKMGGLFPLFQSAKTSLDCHSFSNMMQKDGSVYRCWKTVSINM